MTEKASLPRLSHASAKAGRINRLEAEIDRLITERRRLVIRLEAMTLALLREDRLDLDEGHREPEDRPFAFWP